MVYKGLFTLLDGVDSLRIDVGRGAASRNGLGGKRRHPGYEPKPSRSFVRQPGVFGCHSNPNDKSPLVKPNIYF